MAIVYNPPAPEGAPVPPFNFEGQEYVDQNNKEVLLPCGEVLQFSDAVAQDMVKRWPFLQLITAQKAQELVDQKNWWKCPQCGITIKPEAKLAQEAHMEKHTTEKVEEEVVPNIPQAQSVEATPNKTISERTEQDLTNGPDFYGPGLTDERKGLKPRNVYS